MVKCLPKVFLLIKSDLRDEERIDIFGENHI